MAPLEPQESAQSFFDREGYWPMAPLVYKKPSVKEMAEAEAKRLQMSLRSSSLRGWKAPLHWQVPMAFEYPGRIYEQIGHEAFCEAVEDYYALIGDARVGAASRIHVRWAIKQVLKTFETHVRGFRGQDVGKSGVGKRPAGVFGKGSGQLFHKATGTYSDILTSPETLKEDGRIIADLRQYLRAFGIPESQLEASERLVRAKLSVQWGIKL